MKKVIGLMVSLFLLFSTYAPTFTEAAEVLNKVGWVKENENWYYYEKDGSKRTKNITLDGVEYEFRGDGSFLSGTKKGDNSYSWIEWIHYDAPGKLQNGWSFSATAWSYIKDGKYVTGPFTYQGKQFEINKYGEMEKGWITLRSNIKRVYPKPETKFLLESKPVKDGDILEVIGKQGPWYQVKYQGEIGYVRIFESVVIGESPVRSWDVVKEAANLSHFTMTEYHKDPEKYFPPNIIKKFEKQLDSDANALANGYDFIDKIKADILLDHKQGWIQEDGKWTYYRKDGQRVTDFQTIDGKKYYFGTDGFIKTGWSQQGTKTFYFSPSGAMETGVQYIDGKMYYFNEFGWLTSGLHTFEGKPYYFDDTHEAKSGWMKLEYDWYLLHPNGALQTGDFTYKDKKFSFNQDGEMVKGWITLESLVKKVYPEPDLGKVLRAKRVNNGEVIEVMGKVGSWYEVNYQGVKGYVRIHDAIIFDQEAKNPFTLLDGKLKIFQGVFDYLKNDQILMNDAIKAMEKAEQSALDDVELWGKISQDVDAEKTDVQHKMQVIKEAHDKLQELVNAMKGDIKNLTVTQKKELFKLLGNTKEDALSYGKEWKGFSADLYTTILQNYGALYQAYADYYKALDVVSGKWSSFLKDVADATVEIEKNHRKLAEGLSGVVKDLGPVVNSTIRLKHSIDKAKPAMEELVQVTRKNAPIIAKDLQALDAKVPGFFTDFNMGIDLANTFMDSANRLASHKIDIPAAARNIGNIDLSNALYDLGVPPEKYDEFIAGQNAANQFMTTSLDFVPILNVPKEVIQTWQGKELGTNRPYESSDYVMGIVTLATGGTVKTIGKVVGTVADIENKAKNLEKASKNYRKTFFDQYPELKGNVVVHHAVEQQVLKKYPNLFTEAEIHDIQNLRGIPKEINNEIHLSSIRKDWNEFYKSHPTPTKKEVIDYMIELDKRYGDKFTPPVNK